MKKVTLRELVADKIVFAALITLDYWMWARNDWKDSYQTIQDVIFVFTFFYFISAPRGSRSISRRPSTKWLS